MKKQHQRYADTPQISAIARICLELDRQPDITIGTVAEALASEADAAQRIIALANSELFSSRRTSANLHQALDNLGLHETLILNVACEAFNTLDSFPAGGIDRDAFKHRACIAAAWGITLGREFGRRDSAELMLTALMQDVGILLIAQGAPDTYAGLDPLATDRTSLAQLEFVALNSNHRQAVAWLATTWQLPDNVVRTLRFGHDLAAHDVAPRERGFYRAVNFCGDLAAAWFRPLTVQIVAQLAEDAQQYLGIGPDRLVELFNTVSAQISLLGSILGLDARQPEQHTEIARKIHQLMPASTIKTLPTPASPAPLSESAAPEQAFNLLDATGFAERLNEEFMLTIQHDWPLSLILVEIDGFDDMHLSCGAETSAQIHNEIAALLNRNIRSSDTIGSQSENRFAILLPGSDADMAAMVATRLVDEAHWCIAQHEQAGNLPVTVSLGVATLNEDTPFSRATELSTAAMAALKHSTSSGRDQLTTYASIQAA